MKLNNMASRREFLKELSTSELDRMLQAELRKESIDDDLVRLVLSVLEERERDYPVEINEEIAAAAERFENAIDIQQKRSVKTKWPRVLKVASVLLVVGLLLFALPQAVRAESFFDLLARWTESVFEFFNPAEEQDEQPEYVFKTDHPGLQQIYDAVVEMGVTDPVVPMWVPEGYELEELMVFEEPSELTLCANMKNNESRIYFFVAVQNIHSPRSHMKDTEKVEIFETAGIEHYTLSNNEQITATWIYNNIECSVVADCQEDIYKILESIYTTEAH